MEMNFAKYSVIHARHTPDKTCLIERTPSVNQRRALTWKEFNDEVNRVSNYLSKELDVKKGSIVMHLMNNSLEWLVAYFAIIKLGAIVVPLNYRFVDTDIKYSAEVSECTVFILGSDFLKFVQPIQKEMKLIKHYICVGDNVPDDMIDYKKLQSYEDSSETIVDVEPNHDLAMMFTSGTTGKPKAVMQSHYTLLNVCQGNALSYYVQKNDNHVVYLPLYHSGAMFVWSGYFAQGACGTILREFKDPKWIIEAIAEEKGTGIILVVPIAIALLNAIKNGDIKLDDYDLSNWKFTIVGAQPIPYEIIKELMENVKPNVQNTYGLTEGGGGGTFNLYPEDVLRKPGSIGKPTFGVMAKAVDANGNEVKKGDVGELIFSTPRMMRCYYKNQELTDETVKDGWIYTGDLVTEDDEGFFFVVDRKKDMITSGGENIFPVEIEDAIMEHPKVDDVACIGAPDDRLVEIVMAIVQLKEGESMTEQEVIDFAKTKIATYKLPRKVLFDGVMRNATGKLMKPEMREKFTGRKEAFKKISKD
ncbi:class I adenylate-forming enzyme family protein [Spirochaetota bacterium]